MASAFSNYVTHLVIILYGFWNVNCFYPYFAFFVNCESHFAGNTDHLCLYSKSHSGYRICTSVRPSGLAVAPAIFDPSPQGFLLLFRRIIALSHLKQCSGDNPYHIVEKTVSGDPEADQIVFFSKLVS